MATPAILITGVGGRSVGHQILSALRCVPERYRIMVADADPFSFGLYIGHQSILVPLAHDPNYVDTLKEVTREHRLVAILPGTEPEVRALSMEAAAFQQLGCHVITNPAQVVEICSDKGVLDTWLNDRGFATPRTTQIERWQELVSVVGYPVVGKPGRDTGGSRGVSLLCDERELLLYKQHAPAGSLVQEYVPSEQDEYTVGVLCSPDGTRVIDSIVLRRKLIGLSLGSVRTVAGERYALSTGYSQGFVVENAFVKRRCEELAMVIGARGPLNIQCRSHGEDIKVFEVHPRFSGTTSIRASVGFNEPDVLLRSVLFGETFDSIPHRTGVAVIRAFQHVIVPADRYLGEMPED